MLKLVWDQNFSMGGEKSDNDLFPEWKLKKFLDVLAWIVKQKRPSVFLNLTPFPQVCYRTSLSQCQWEDMLITTPGRKSTRELYASLICWCLSAARDVFNCLGTSRDRHWLPVNGQEGSFAWLYICWKLARVMRFRAEYYAEHVSWYHILDISEIGVNR